MNEANVVEVTLDQVLAAFKKLTERPSNFMWYTFARRDRAAHLTGFKIDSHQLNIYHRAADEDPDLIIYPDRIEYSYDQLKEIYTNEGLLQLITLFQEDADKFYEEHVKPVLYDPENIQVPEGFRSQFEEK